MSRVGKYVNGSDVDDLESLTKRLMLDLRSHIKGLVYPKMQLIYRNLVKLALISGFQWLMQLFVFQIFQQPYFNIKF